MSRQRRGSRPRRRNPAIEGKCRKHKHHGPVKMVPDGKLSLILLCIPLGGLGNSMSRLGLLPCSRFIAESGGNFTAADKAPITAERASVHTARRGPQAQGR